MTNLIGQSMGRYHILEQIGEGGMATVYKAYDTRLERDVAIKIIRRDAFPPNQLERILKRFEREAKSLAKLSHPNIVKVHDFGDYESVPYLVMEYLPGGTLKALMGKTMPWQQAVRLLIPVANALEYAHEHKVIHRDVKPANILMTEKGQPMLTDFGIAKILESDDGQTLTGTGVGIGTPEYMAPEQGLGREIDGRADIYSLGIIFYELVTGRKPYTADTPMAVVLKHNSDPLPNPRQYVPNLPDSVHRVLLKVLAKNQHERYANSGLFTESLENLLGSNQNQTDANVQRLDATQDSIEINNDLGVLKEAQNNTKSSQPLLPHTVFNKKKRNINLFLGIGLGVVGMILFGILVVWLPARGFINKKEPSNSNPATIPIPNGTVAANKEQISTATKLPVITNSPTQKNESTTSLENKSDSNIPKILFDETHGGQSINFSRAKILSPEHPDYVDGTDFANKVGKYFRIDAFLQGPITSDTLTEYDVLILPGDQWFSSRETEAIHDFVNQGGGLLVLGDGSETLNTVLEPLGIAFRGRPVASLDNPLWDAWSFNITIAKKDVEFFGGETELTINAGGVMEVKDASLVIAWTSPNSWWDANENQKRDSGEINKAYPLIAKTYSGNGRVIVMSDSSIWGDGFENNKNIIIAFLDWLISNQ